MGWGGNHGPGHAMGTCHIAVVSCVTLLIMHESLQVNLKNKQTSSFAFRSGPVLCLFAESRSIVRFLQTFSEVDSSVSLPVWGPLVKELDSIK